MIVYTATNTVNGMQYVGLTRRKSLGPRVAEHFATARNTIKGGERTLANAIRVFGEAAFKFEELARCQTLKELSRLERKWIAKLGTIWPGGYNVKKGGCPTFKLAAGDVYEICGVKYYGCGELAEHFPISIHNIRHRILRAGWTPEQAVELAPPPPPPRRRSGLPPSPVCVSMDVEGVHFSSIKDACDHYGIRDGLFHSRRRQGWTVEEALGISARQRPVREYRSITVDGLSFSSVKKAADHFGIRAGCVTQRLQNGWTIEEAFGLEKRRSHPNSVPVGPFPNLAEASQATGIAQATISWRTRNGWTPEEALGISPVHGNNQNLR